jgi:hypothetical protein
MEGGVAILLLLIIVVVAAGIGVVMYLTGGAFWLRDTGSDTDEPDESEKRFSRDEHGRPVAEPTHGHVIGKPRHDHD